MRTAEPWQPASLTHDDNRTVCVTLYLDRVDGADGRLCADPSPTARSGLRLRYTTLSAGGEPMVAQDLAALVVRPSATTLRASIPPAALGLKPGRYAWQARARSEQQPCEPKAPCTDLLPDGGPVPFRIALATQSATRSRCFGAASRNPVAPCRDPRLRLSVVPSPAAAQLAPNFPCKPLERDSLVSPCEFGVPAPQARRTMALIGDSHAAHWRAAFEQAAVQQRWRGVSITRTSCPFSRSTPQLDELSRRQCNRWNAELPAWLAKHPEIATVVLTSHAGSSVVVRRRSERFETKVAGYGRAFDSLPASVRHVIVLRDSPDSTHGTLPCIARAARRRFPPGRACARLRARAVTRDPAVVAATRSASKRLETVSLTSSFCGTARCFPVIGGALVYKDATHLTDVFSSTLGPALSRALGRTRAFGGR